MKHIKLAIVISFILIILVISGFLVVNRTKTQMRELFRMNKNLQKEGYYMGDFEFKSMSMAYWLDKGQYIKALSQLNKFHKQLKTREGLSKLSEFSNKEEEMEFFLNLQNPKTGAFIDDSYAYCVYNEITENTLNHLDVLAKKIGKPLQLKYPLTYLDEINTPAKLTAFLDEVSYIGKIASKFPQTTFVFARSVLSYNNGEGVIEKNNLYEFSPEWKEALLKWFYEFQDSETGFWGPRSKNGGKIIGKDLNNTASVIKAFIDRNGNDIHVNFPLRYKDKILKTTLEVLSEPIPDNGGDIHEWNLKETKGINMLARFLLPNASVENKNRAKMVIEDYIRIKFSQNYIPKEGAFSYYPNEEHATLDGMGDFFLFNTLGAFSPDIQKRLWGCPEENIINMGKSEVAKLHKNDFESIPNSTGVNSIRIYSTTSINDYLENVEMIFYPKDTPVLDIMDLTPKVYHWAKTTSQTMGNWASKEDVLQKLESISIAEIPVYEDGIPLEKINEILQNKGKVVAIGFDVLQIPRYEIIYKLKD